MIISLVESVPMLDDQRRHNIPRTANLQCLKAIAFLRIGSMKVRPSVFFIDLANCPISKFSAINPNHFIML
jgi:hypothetical protein